jgi:sec-independent protein translocase protein TatC
MATALRPIGHDERLSLVEHLDELRSRLIVCVAALVVAFSVCFWQSDAILDVVNRPLEQTQTVDGTKRSSDPLEQTARFEIQLGEAMAATAPALEDLRASIATLARSASLTAAERADLARRAARLDAALRQIRQAAAAVPTNRERHPVTLGPAEPFTATVSISLYAGILLALPVILYQLYAFVLPAFSPAERRIAFPLMLIAPLLFLAGAAFAYLLVLPRAIGFLQNFNDDSFDILLSARDYYRFAVLFVGGVGLMFQMPLAILALTRTGVVDTRQLRANRGYVILGIAVVAAVATPTPDPVTMSLAMGPLVLLFELSVLLAARMERRARRRLLREEDAERTSPDREEPDAV